MEKEEEAPFWSVKIIGFNYKDSRKMIKFKYCFKTPAE